ncbi:MAG: hypothetical protein H6Q36_958 [Chloroflexi bacterium]|jgi:hypothetical protein|nr:hypothetical protein [Chloroflexota bacterium]
MSVHPAPQRPATLVWIDAQEALVLRWRSGAEVTRLVSEVPPRRRAVGGDRRDPTIRAGGGGVADDQVERHRRAHLERFVREVAALVPPDDRAVIIGPGTVRERLAGELSAGDRRHGRQRPVEVEPAGRMTEPQLVARLRQLQGTAAPRRAPSGPR